MAETQRERAIRTNERISEVKGKRKKEKAAMKKLMAMGQEDFHFILGKKDLKTAVRGLTDKRLAALHLFTERYVGTDSLGTFIHVLAQQVITERFINQHTTT